MVALSDVIRLRHSGLQCRHLRLALGDLRQKLLYLRLSERCQLLVDILCPIARRFLGVGLRYFQSEFVAWTRIDGGRASGALHHGRKGGVRGQRLKVLFTVDTCLHLGIEASEHYCLCLLCLAHSPMGCSAISSSHRILILVERVIVLYLDVFDTCEHQGSFLYVLLHRLWQFRADSL